MRDGGERKRGRTGDESLPDPFERDGVYLVRSEQDRSALLAIAPRLGGGRIAWYDSVRYRSFPVLEVRRLSDAVAVVTPQATYRFEPLDLARYERFVRRRVAGHPRFGSDDELRRHYLALPR